MAPVENAQLARKRKAATPQWRQRTFLRITKWRSPRWRSLCNAEFGESWPVVALGFAAITSAHCATHLTDAPESCVVFHDLPALTVPRRSMGQMTAPVMLGCLHNFCGRCVDALEHPRCPLCQTPFTRRTKVHDKKMDALSKALGALVDDPALSSSQEHVRPGVSEQDNLDGAFTQLLMMTPNPVVRNSTMLSSGTDAMSLNKLDSSSGDGAKGDKDSGSVAPLGAGAGAGAGMGDGVSTGTTPPQLRRHSSLLGSKRVAGGGGPRAGSSGHTHGSEDAERHKPGADAIVGSDSDTSIAAAGESDICAVCLKGESWVDNTIVFCDGCDVAVHQQCYGVRRLPKGEWRCDVCRSGSTSAAVECTLCGRSGAAGAMKPTNRKSDAEGSTASKQEWAHVFCAMWVPEVVFGDAATKKPVQVDDIPRARYKLRCTVCKKTSKGACIQCCHGRCAVAFHPMCALVGKLRMKIVAADNTNGVKYLSYCARHSGDAETHVGRSAAKSRRREQKRSGSASSKAKRARLTAGAHGATQTGSQHRMGDKSASALGDDAEGRDHSTKTDHAGAAERAAQYDTDLGETLVHSAPANSAVLRQAGGAGGPSASDTVSKVAGNRGSDALPSTPQRADKRLLDRSLVGRRVRMFDTIDNRWRFATISGCKRADETYSPVVGAVAAGVLVSQPRRLERTAMRHQVAFDSGEVEWLDLGMEMFEVVEESPVMGTPPTRLSVFAPTDVVLLSTGLRVPQINKLQRMARRLGCTVVNDYSDSVTHLITQTKLVAEDSSLSERIRMTQEEAQEVVAKQRTMKYLRAVLGGKWCLGFNWVVDCLKANSIVAEDDYEVASDAMAVKAEGVPRHGPRRARQERRPLLQNFLVLLVGEFCHPRPGPQHVASLVTELGGTMVNTAERFVDGDGHTRRLALCASDATRGASYWPALLTFHLTPSRPCSATDGS